MKKTKKVTSLIESSKNHSNISMSFPICSEQKKFDNMLFHLSGMLHNKYPNAIFVIDMEETSLDIFSKSALWSSFRLTGNLINKDTNAKICGYKIWCFNDSERSHGWLFSEKGPFFGKEVIL